MTHLQQAKKSLELAGLDQEKLYSSLRTMGRKHVKGADMKASWCWENPTRNYCYVVSEMIYFYLSPLGTQPMSLEVSGDPGLHRFLIYPNGDIIDATCDQFPDTIQLDYTKAKKRGFMQTGGKGPSKRARMLSELMELKPYEYL